MSAPIPETAIARLRKLEDRAADLRAAALDAQEDFAAARTEIGRIETALQSHGRGRRLEVDEHGRVFHREERRERIEQPAPGVRVDHFRTEARYFDDPGLAADAREIVRLRREAAEAAARREAVTARLAPVVALAAACRTELERRGWRERDTLSVPNPVMSSVERSRPITRKSA